MLCIGGQKNNNYVCKGAIPHLDKAPLSTYTLPHAQLRHDSSVGRAMH